MHGKSCAHPSPGTDGSFVYLELRDWLYYGDFRRWEASRGQNYNLLSLYSKSFEEDTPICSRGRSGNYVHSGNLSYSLRNSATKLESLSCLLLRRKTLFGEPFPTILKSQGLSAVETISKRITIYDISWQAWKGGQCDVITLQAMTCSCRDKHAHFILGAEHVLVASCAYVSSMRKYSTSVAN